MRLIRKGEQKMRVNYSDQKLPFEVNKMIFLAGPTPRSKEVKSWRGEAIEILEKFGYDGDVFIPEPSDGEFKHSYDNQIEWELEAMKRADMIVFWVPRDLKDMPALTTNVEFGAWVESGKIVLGYPKEAEKMRYLDFVAKKEKVTVFDNLEDTLKFAVEKIGKGSERTGAEVEIPLLVWNTKSFQNWYKAQTEAGNKLQHANLKYTLRAGKNKDFVFFWILHVEVYIPKEDRVKDIEYVLSRTDTTAILMYHKGQNIFDTDVILVKEFRSPATTLDGYIWELPGGSSHDESESALQVAADEVFEETDFKFDSKRLKQIQRRQLNGTLLANKTQLFALELTDEEIKWFKSQIGSIHGVVEDTEMAYTEVMNVKDILDNELLDWSNIGMIMKVLIDEFK